MNRATVSPTNMMESTCRIRLFKSQRQALDIDFCPSRLRPRIDLAARAEFIQRSKSTAKPLPVCVPNFAQVPVTASRTSVSGTGQDYCVKKFRIDLGPLISRQLLDGERT